MSTVNNELPPYITFERRAVEDRTASLAAGHHVSKDVDFVTITRPGSSDSVEKEVAGWLAELPGHAKNNRMPQAWVTAFQDAYKRWQAGEELPEQGTPIKGWPVLGPAAQKDLIHAGIRTVEALAAMPDNELANVCMGALSFKAKARAWLESAQDKGKIAETVATQERDLADLRKTVEAQAAEIKRLLTLIPQESKK